MQHYKARWPIQYMIITYKLYNNKDREPATIYKWPPTPWVFARTTTADLL